MLTRGMLPRGFLFATSVPCCSASKYDVNRHFPPFESFSWTSNGNRNCTTCPTRTILPSLPSYHLTIFTNLPSYHLTILPSYHLYHLYQLTILPSLPSLPSYHLTILPTLPTLPGISTISTLPTISALTASTETIQNFYLPVAYILEKCKSTSVPMVRHTYKSRSDI